MKKALVILIFALMACAPQRTINITVPMKNLVVHVLSENEMWRELIKRSLPGEYRAFTAGNDVYVLGEYINGQIHVRHLGHEIEHQLDIRYPGFRNPDGRR